MQDTSFGSPKEGPKKPKQQKPPICVAAGNQGSSPPRTVNSCSSSVGHRPPSRAQSTGHGSSTPGTGSPSQTPLNSEPPRPSIPWGGGGGPSRGGGGDEPRRWSRCAGLQGAGGGGVGMATGCVALCSWWCLLASRHLPPPFP